MRGIHKARLVAAVSAGVLVLGAISGCAAGGESESSDSDRPVVRVGANVGAPPYGDFAEDGKTFVSFEADMIRAIGEEQGFDVEFTILDNAGMFTALDSGRLDVLAFGMGDRKSRQEKYDLLDDAKDATGFLVRAGEADKITEMPDTCGLRIGVSAGTSQEQFWTDYTKECAASGLDEVKLLTFNTEAAGYTALRSGQIDALSTNVPVLATFAAGSNGETEVVQGVNYLEGYVGMLFPKGSELSLQMQKGLQSLIDSGKYSEIMEKWGISELEVDEALFNQGTAE